MGKPQPKKREILLVGLHNTTTLLMATLILQDLLRKKGIDVNVSSAGVYCGKTIPKNVISVLKNHNLDILNLSPSSLNCEGRVKSADLIICFPGVEEEIINQLSSLNNATFPLESVCKKTFGVRELPLNSTLESVQEMFINLKKVIKQIFREIIKIVTPKILFIDEANDLPSKVGAQCFREYLNTQNRLSEFIVCSAGIAKPLNPSQRNRYIPDYPGIVDQATIIVVTERHVLNIFLQQYPKAKDKMFMLVGCRKKFFRETREDRIDLADRFKKSTQVTCSSILRLADEKLAK